ncbi:MAG: BamA/TamA family outer membrane protein [Bacteroidota bacterium]
MKKFKLTYFILFLSVIVLFSCNLTKNVPNGYHLVDKNNIIFEDEKLNIDEVSLIIRQQANRKSFGFRLKLYTYNSIDSAKVMKVRLKQYNKIKKKNKKKLDKQNRINAKRIAKAQAKGDTLYTERLIPLLDTINPKLSFREWIKYKRGEKPVIFDSILYEKSIKQLNIYLKKKGYYYGNVSGTYKDNVKNPKRREITYTIKSGKAYYIDSLVIDCPNAGIKSDYERYIRKQAYNPIIGEKFDADYLDNHRYIVAKYIRDRSVYGFSPSNISFVADTNNSISDMKITLYVKFTDRQIKLKNSDSIITIPFQATEVKNVYFHIIDTSYMSGYFKKTLEKRELTLMDNSFLRTIDTFSYKKILLSKKEKRERKLNVSEEILNPWRFTTVYYNGKPAVKPAILELQNYLENENTYKDYYIDRSYNRLMQLDVFQTIKPVIKEIEGTNKIEVHYYLVPSKKQAFNLEPRFTNSNGFLGLAASVNYNNRNLFRGSEKLTLSFSGGFESQPPIFDENLDGSKIQKAGRSFNTFEIGPSVKLDLPGLFLLRKATKLSKRHRPRTVLSTAYNFQKRTDFTRKVFQLNYLWKFYVEKTQVIQFGFPAASIKFVQIDPSAVFQAKLDANNDLFLKNAYSDQFIWEDFKLMYEFNNKLVENKKKINIVYNASFSSAGFLLSKIGLKDTTETGQNKIFGVGFSQFLRLDNDVILGLPLNKKSSVHARASAGFGVPLGENTTSLPYDYSFFAGGSNDNRGWRARALGPGSYKYYLDKGRTATQIGDVRLGLFGELRYSLSSTFKTALFIDAGNIWTSNYDVNRVGSQFSKNFYKEIAVTIGTGLRIDMSFFVIRFDLGLPLTNPALPNGEKWIFQKHPKYIQEGIDTYGEANYKAEMPKPFIPIPSFGIGYPF